jgi:Divergent InlB B-repeat domain/NHL repeat
VRTRACLSLLLGVALAVLGLGAAAAPAAEPVHPFRGTLTGEKIGLFEQFKGACGVAIDAKGDIYVADYYQNRVVVFNEKEELLTKITGINPLDSAGVAPVDGPCDLAVDSSGRLYVNDYHRDVVSFTPAKYPPEKGTAYTPAATISTAHPTGVAVDSGSGDVYVNERTSVAVYDSAGVEQSRIGAGSIEDGYGVAVSGYGPTLGRVYVADGATDTVKVYEPGKPAEPVEAIDGSGTPREGFRFLDDTDLAIDPANGHLYVADDLKPHFEKPEAIVYEFSAAGHYRGQVPTPAAEGENSFLVDGEPTGLAIASDGDIYVTSGNYENAVVFVFGPGDSSPTRVLSVAKTGTGSGTVFSSPPGLRCGSACEGEFNEGGNVNLTATPEPHNRLVGWTGCQTNLTPTTCQVTMNIERAVSAEFEPIPQRSLTVARTGSGSGTILSAPAGIECGGACEGGFDEGSTVTLTAAPAPGSRLAGWSGCDSQPSATACEVAMSGGRSVGAEFEPEPEVEPPPPPAAQHRTLTVTSTGLGAATGSVRSAPAGIECGASCTHVYERGAPLVLTAEPAPGSIFLGWGGCEGTSGTTCRLTLGADRTVAAAFGPAPAGPLRVHKAVVKGAMAKLTVAVPGPGTLAVEGKWLRSAKTLPLAAGDVVLRVGLSPAGQRELAGSDRLKAKAALSFAPLEGGPTLKLSRPLTFGPPTGRKRPYRARFRPVGLGGRGG